MINRNTIGGDASATMNHGIYVSNANDGIDIWNNMIYGFTISGVTLIDYSPVETMTLYFNSIYMEAASGGDTCVHQDGATVEARNNIYFQDGSGGYCYWRSSGSLDSDYNDFYRPNGADTGFWSSPQATLANWQSASGKDANSFDIDPEYVSTTDLHLQSTSGMIGEAEVVSSVTDDIDGDERDGTTPDIGADEETTAGSTTAPTEPTDLLVEGLAPPAGIDDPHPEFSAQYNDPDIGDTADKYRVQVSTDSAFASVTHWDSGALGTTMGNTTEGTQCPDIVYDGTALNWGVAYYLRIKFWDVGGEEGEWSDDETMFSLLPPSTTLPNGPGAVWQMIAVTSGTSVSNTSISGLCGTFYTWDETAQSWVKSTTLEPGVGYVIYSEPVVVTLTEGMLVSGNFGIAGLTSTPSAGSALAGWQMVGNPYNGSIDWDAVMETAPLPTNIESTYWKWDGTQYLSYNASTDLGPAGASIPMFQGFWVRVLPMGSIGSLTLKEPGIWGKPVVPDPFDDNWWLLQVSAAAGPTVRDDYNWVGIHEEAEDGWDPRDSSDPGSIADPNIKLYMMHDDWGPYEGRYAQDVRRVPTDEDSMISWTVTVEASITPMVITLSWPNLSEMPGAWLFDLDGVELSSLQDYTYTQESAVETFTLTATREGQGGEEGGRSAGATRSGGGRSGCGLTAVESRSGSAQSGVFALTLVLALGMALFSRRRPVIS